MTTDSQLLRDQQALDAALKTHPDAYIAYAKNVNKRLYLSVNDDENWYIELARDGWYIPCEDEPYKPHYSAASQQIEDVLSVVNLLQDKGARNEPEKSSPTLHWYDDASADDNFPG